MCTQGSPRLRSWQVHHICGYACLALYRAWALLLLLLSCLQVVM
jgi:hypothetical protein